MPRARHLPRKIIIACQKKSASCSRIGLDLHEGPVDGLYLLMHPMLAGIAYCATLTGEEFLPAKRTVLNASCSVLYKIRYAGNEHLWTAVTRFIPPIVCTSFAA
jgi:hypothetical protein